MEEPRTIDEQDMEDTLVLDETIFGDIKKARTIAEAIEKKLANLPTDGILYLDLAPVRECAFRCADFLVRALCKSPKEKKIFLINGTKAVIKNFEIALNVHKRSTLWIDESKTARILGTAFSTKQYKHNGYKTLLQYVREKQVVTTKDVSDDLKFSQSLAHYKLDKLYEWSILDRARVMVETGGVCYVYFPVDQAADFHLVID